MEKERKDEEFLTTEDVLKEWEAYARSNGFPVNGMKSAAHFKSWAIDEIQKLGIELGKKEIESSLPMLVSSDMRDQFELRKRFEKSLNQLQTDMLEKRPKKYWEFYAKYLEQYALGNLKEELK